MASKGKEILSFIPKEGQVTKCFADASLHQKEILNPLLDTHATTLKALLDQGITVAVEGPEQIADGLRQLVEYILKVGNRSILSVSALIEMAREPTMVQAGLIRHVIVSEITGRPDHININRIVALRSSTTDGKIQKIKGNPNIIHLMESEIFKKAVAPLLVALDEEALRAEAGLSTIVGQGKGLAIDMQDLPNIFKRAKNAAHDAQSKAEDADKRIKEALANDGVLQTDGGLMAKDGRAERLLEIITNNSQIRFDQTVRAVEATARAARVKTAVVSGEAVLDVTGQHVQDLAAISFVLTLAFYQVLAANAYMEAMTAQAVTKAESQKLWNGCVATIAKQYQRISSALTDPSAGADFLLGRNG